MQYPLLFVVFGWYIYLFISVLKVLWSVYGPFEILQISLVCFCSYKELLCNSCIDNNYFVQVLCLLFACLLDALCIIWVNTTKIVLRTFPGIFLTINEHRMHLIIFLHFDLHTCIWSVQMLENALYKSLEK